mgnify:CR=1 FL=1
MGQVDRETVTKILRRKSDSRKFTQKSVFFLPPIADVVSITNNCTQRCVRISAVFEQKLPEIRVYNRHWNGDVIYCC